MSNITTNSMTLKEINVGLIRDALKSEEHCTKNTLSKSTGLSVATCGNIIKSLIDTNEVIEINKAKSTGGRPSRVFKYNYDFAHTASVYARKEGKYNTLVCVVCNLSGDIVYEYQEEFQDLSSQSFFKVLDTLISKYDTISAISVGVPGIVNNGVIGLCDFSSLEGCDIENTLKTRYSLPVICENDVNLSSLGYYHTHKDSESADSIAYLYYPVNGNPGTGLILDGKILLGNSNFAGEVSHLPLGVGLKRQRTIQKDQVQFSSLVSKTIACLNCVINPSTVVLSGYMFTEELLWKIRDQIAEITPHNHIPNIQYEEDFNDSYVAGLTYIALELLHCKIQISQKKSRS